MTARSGRFPTCPAIVTAGRKRALRLMRPARRTSRQSFIQEVHRPDGIDFGHEPDGDATEHCFEDRPGTALAVTETGILSSDHVVPERRYPAFFGTDLEILLKGPKAETLLLVGGLTDVCAPYLCRGAPARLSYVRVIEDCVAGSSVMAHDASLTAMEYLQTGARRSLSDVTAAFAL